MRLDELVLERYGAFEERRLKLDASPFTVVYGPNEAGKSTCLQAISDFFFKIPEGSKRLQRFGSDAARIHVVLTSADGRRMRLQRRYGRVRTLIGEDGNACDDAVLTGLLGPTTRDRFENLFGLDHRTLRDGGETLLGPDGDIGRLIVEAGGGLRALVGRLAAIDVEIDGLFAPRRKESRTFYRSLTSFEEASRAARASQLTHDVWDRDRKALDAAVAALEDARRSRRETIEGLSRSTRLERTIPHLRALDAVEARLASYGDVRPLDGTFPARCDDALEADAIAGEALAKARTRHAEVAGRREALVVDDRLEAVEAEIRDVASRIEIVANSRTSRANRDRDRHEAEGQLAALRDRLGHGPGVDLAPLMPAASVLDAVRGLIARDAALRPAAASKREAAAAALAAATVCADAVEAMVLKGLDRPFGVAMATFDTLVARHAAAGRRLEDAGILAAECRDRAAAAGLPDAATLRDISWPAEEVVRSEVRAREAIEAERGRQGVIRADAVLRRDVALACVVELGRAGAPTTLEALAEARRIRDDAWTALRRAHVAGGGGGSGEREAAAQVLDDAMRGADLLADRRVEQADKAAALADAGRRIAEAEATMGAVEGRLLELAGVAGARERAFREAFPRACALRPDAAALLDATLVRRTLVSGLAAAEAAREEGTNAFRDVEPLVDQLLAAERKAALVADASDTLAMRVQTLGAFVAAHDEGHAEYRREQRDLVLLQAKAGEAERASVLAQKGMQAWRNDWTVAMTDLGQASTTTTEAADALVTGWIGAKGELRSLALTDRRLAGMDNAEAALADRVGALSARLAIAVAEEPVAGGTMLVERWKANAAAGLARRTLAPEVSSAAGTLEECARMKAATEARLAELRREAGVADDAALRSAALRRRGLEALRGELESSASDARLAGDGLPVAALREQAEGRDLDATRALVCDLEQDLGRRDADLEAAIRAEAAAGAALATHEGNAGSVRAVAKREAAAAAMAEAVERYVELTLARDLVAKAIQTVRSERQDPLVREAGAMFAAMTGGEFSRMEADVDIKGMPTVVGVKTDGSGRQPVAIMSDGTRDQLYLAFRLASIAGYGAAAEPIPLIADDALVHFDDDRSSATMDLLAEFSAKTQVLLFTHHGAVRDAAERLARQGRAALVELT